MDLDQLILRAWEDPEFKAALLRDPKATLEAALGVALPEDLTIFVHEQTPTEVHLVLPLPPEY